MLPTSAAKLLIGWTTVADRIVADRLAADAVAQGIAACVQIEGPITSYYRWEGKVERAEEFRLTFKFVPAQRVSLEQYIRDHHPYDTPEWIVVGAGDVGEKYLSWAEANSTNPPL
jgi:periplasmic divalent cation tolerance protein